jgi:CheY-like chemotaxis protein
MGGEMSVESIPGEGSVFSLSVPLRQPDDNTQALPDISPSNSLSAADGASKKWRILVAEDQPINAKLMTAIMSRLGHELTIAPNGVEVIKELRQNEFDLVLMDIQMPEMDGILATKVIRSSDEVWHNIPIIALTAHAMAGTRDTYLQAGMNGFVSKPISIDTLIHEIGIVMNETQQDENTTSQAAEETASASAPIDADEEAFLSDMLNDLAADDDQSAA